MVLLLRTLARLMTFVLLCVLAITGLAVAIFSIQDGDDGLSLPQLADYLNLPEIRDIVGRFLAQVGAEGPVAVKSALAGVAAMLVGVALLIGAMTPRRERLVVLERGREGTLAARRRALGQAAAAIIRQVHGVTDTKVRVRPRRTRGGRLAARASHPPTASGPQVQQEASEALGALTGPFNLRARVRTTLATAGARGSPRVR